ncbi:unnamed protein product [Adineta steineri]|uniref:Uncharacterized protein n=1 Tax=Adineta steineri TaxID=433720 RepID=A0A815SN85_9BILA|nr:unnamed protein product [Adineta steineri]
MAQATPSHASDRFLDADKEPNKMLLPIEGYENYPLVSLEEAVEPLKSLLHDLDVMVMISKRNSRKPKDGLTIDESAAIHLYTLQWDESQDIHRLPNISTNAKWTQYGVTVAGGHGPGDSLNQLSTPSNIYIDENRTMYITDNNRVLEWKCDATSGEVMAGGNGKGNRADQLNGPSDLFVDKSTDSMIICDWGNKRVMRWPYRNGTSGETILSNFMCSRLTMDDQGALYVSDYGKGEVRRYRTGDVYGEVVAGGNGHGNNLNQLHWPASVFVDRDRAVYVSEINNHRVVKWNENAQVGTVVAAGCGPGNNLTQLHSPRGIIVDQLGSLYVADCLNHRIMRWCKGKTEGDVIVGGNGQGNRADQLSIPAALSFDQDGNLYVVDTENHRVQRFNIV